MGVVPGIATPDDLDARTSRALAAAVGARRDHPRELPFLSSFDRTTTESLDFPESRPDLIDPSDLDRAAAALGLPTLNREVLAVMNSAAFLQAIACLALVPRLPILAEGLKLALQAWRTTTPAF